MLYRIPAIIGEVALSKNLEKDRTPRVVAATPSPTRSKAAAVRIGWSLKRNVPSNARMTIKNIELPENGTNNTVITPMKIMPGIRTIFRPNLSER